jgi:hypothetical protein
MGQAEKLTPYIYAHKLNYQNIKINVHYRRRHLQSVSINCSIYSIEYYITALVHNATLFCSISRYIKSNLYINPLAPDFFLILAHPVCEL